MYEATQRNPESPMTLLWLVFIADGLLIVWTLFVRDRKRWELYT